MKTLAALLTFVPVQLAEPPRDPGTSFDARCGPEVCVVKPQALFELLARANRPCHLRNE